MSPNPATLPVIFLGHGNPMNAIGTNAWTRAWRALGDSLPRPRAILSVSAHWYTRGTGVTAMPTPRTIHDFGGFPRELHEVEYPAPGDPALAERIATMLAPLEVGLDFSWGLDHGTWSVLVHIFPDASVPVVQLSIDRTKPGAFHLELGGRLAPLRDEGVLILGSGNVVHNLETAAWGGSAPPYDWALRFDRRVRELLDSGDRDALARLDALGNDARLSAPTPDHYLPLLYVLGASRGEPPSYPVDGFDMGSISMLSVRFG